MRCSDVSSASERRSNAPAVWLTAFFIVLLAVALHSSAWAVKAYTRDFRVEDCTWDHKSIQNPYFILRPGYRLILEGEEDGAEIVAQITVLRERESIAFESAKGQLVRVSARVVEEREWEDGELVEVSRNWFSVCAETSDVYYFGEEVDDYEDGEIVGHGGAWRAGQNGALPGIIMPGTFLLGARYFQELAPDVAMDRGKNVDMGLDVTVPAGSFTDCVAVKDTSLLDPGAADFKIYCPGIGIVMDAELALTEVAIVPKGAE